LEIEFVRGFEWKRTEMHLIIVLRRAVAVLRHVSVSERWPAASMGNSSNWSAGFLQAGWGRQSSLPRCCRFI